MAKIFLTLAVLISCTIAAQAQTTSATSNVSTNVTSFKDGSGNQWVTLTPVTFSSARKSNIKVTYDDYDSFNDPNGVYKGKDNKSYDGVRQNKVRNINYYDSGVKLPPNSGRIQ